MDTPIQQTPLVTPSPDAQGSPVGDLPKSDPILQSTAGPAIANTLKALVVAVPIFAGILHAIGYARLRELCVALKFSPDLFEVSTSRYILEGYSAFTWTAGKVATTVASWEFVGTLHGAIAMTGLAVVLVILVEKRKGPKIRGWGARVSRSALAAASAGAAGIALPFAIASATVLLAAFVALPLLVGELIGAQEAKAYLANKQPLEVFRPAVPNGEMQCLGVLVIANDKHRGWLDAKSRIGCVETSDGKVIAKWKIPESPSPTGAAAKP